MKDAVYTYGPNVPSIHVVPSTLNHAKSADLKQYLFQSNAVFRNNICSYSRTTQNRKVILKTPYIFV